MSEDQRQQKPVSSSQLTTIMESALVDPSSTQPVGRQQPVDETKSEPLGTQQQAKAHEFEYEDELIEETKFEPVAKEMRYPLKQRKPSTRYL